MDHAAKPRSEPPRAVSDLARALGLVASDWTPCGSGGARVDLGLLAREPIRDNARYVVVCAVEPPRARPGLTATAVALAAALGRAKHRSLCTVEAIPTSGGPGTVLPEDAVVRAAKERAEAVAAAHVLLAAAADREGVRLDGAFARGAPEVSAVLTLATDRADLDARLARMIVGASRDGATVRAGDLGVDGELAGLLGPVLEPTLLQGTDGSPVIASGAPGGDAEFGGASNVADLLAMRCADVVVTAAPDATVLAVERFFNVKCRASGLRPRAAVLTWSVVGEDSATEATDLARGVAALRLHGLPVVVAVERHPSDADAGISRTADLARAAGAFDVAVTSVTSEGAAGAAALAGSVERAVAEPPEFRFLYARTATLRQKLTAVALRVLGAAGVSLSPQAAQELALAEAEGGGGLPVSVAAPPGVGAADGSALSIRAVRASFGAGFVTAYAGAEGAG